MPSRSGSLIVITGPPGAGKSTVADALAARMEPSVLVEGDRFFGFLASGAVEPWLSEAQEQNKTVTRAAASATGQFVRGGYSTVYDGVVGPWFLPTFAESSQLDSFDYVVLLPSPDVCVHRVVTRKGHGFTDEAATRRMHAEFANATMDDRHVMVDPPVDLEPVIAIIAQRRRAGDLVYRGP